MLDPDTEVTAFLLRAGWSDAQVQPLAVDASTRSYRRLTDDTGRTAILMDASGDRGSLERFLRIADLLRSADLSAPDCLAVDLETGLALFEDFGDGIFARRLETDPGREPGFYAPAVDVLLALDSRPLTAGLPVFTSRDYLEKASASLRWYPGVGPEADSAIQAVLETVLAKTDTAPRVLSLRDYHAENLIWLPGRDGLRRVGLLDFQDAVAGHPAYDLVSLLWDVRRDVSPQTRERMMAHYVARSGFSEAAFLRDAAILNAQRNLRILTQFARLVVRDGKPRYLAMMPRVWSNLQSALRHPDLADLSQVVHRHVAPPTSDLIERLSRACQTAPVE